MLETPKANRLHIALFGRRNAGKSSIINALAKQEVAIVSEVPGTTTDPVYKAMEVLPIGPVMLIDTAGIDDEGGLGSLRVQRSLEVLSKTDVVILLVPADEDITEYEKFVIEECRQKEIVVLPVISKIDICGSNALLFDKLKRLSGAMPVEVSSITGDGIMSLIQTIIDKAPYNFEMDYIVADIVNPGDTVVLVVPIDSAAPKGRLILPQVQTLRDLLDNECIAMVVKENLLSCCLANLKTKPKLVITDSQVFAAVEKIVPQDVLLTSFSILFARYKGDLSAFLDGAARIKQLKPGDRVLIAEACSHHRQEDDIGTVKIPRWLEEYVGGELKFDWCSGDTFPGNIGSYRLVVHCGGCMINRKQMLSRIQLCKKNNVPVVNYGIAIACLTGILNRVIAPFTMEIKAL